MGKCLGKSLQKIGPVIDYKPGDWVETCHTMPAVVQKVDVASDTVYVFYPHYAIKNPGKYNGYSQCSICSCGVHKITPQHAMKLMAIGESKLNELIRQFVESGSDWKNWEKFIESYYEQHYES